MRRMDRVLGWAALVEILSLGVLLVNLATSHLKAITSAVGPVHGTAYLTVIVAAFMVSAATRGTRLLALVPGIGGYLALRRYHATRGRRASESDVPSSREGR